MLDSCVCYLSFFEKLTFLGFVIIQSTSVGVTNYSRRTNYYYYIPTIITHLYILRFHDLAGGVLKFVVLNRDNHCFKQPQLNLSVFG